jgi:UDP-glucose-4-epimerase GalE
MKVLVTGGAGYIGSIVASLLIEAGYRVVVADNLSGGRRQVVDGRAEFENVDLCDPSAVRGLFGRHAFCAVVHIAGVISVAESVRDPSRYFLNNVYASLNLFHAMGEHGVKKVIFSSTAAVYGSPVDSPIAEDHPQIPQSPYGESKLMVERMLRWYRDAHGIRAMSLRYFNAAGSSLDGRLGEDHEPETHIIPLALRAARAGAPFRLFGDDFPTHDGTCVRDYVHVVDLAGAHLLALHALIQGHEGGAYNVGTGKGHSNREVLSMVESVTGRSLHVIVEERREGDAAALVADPTRIKRELDWEPVHSDLRTIVESAWEYEKRRPRP